MLSYRLNLVPGPHLGHDAARAPHVHRGAVVPLAEQQLGRPVPEGDHPVGVPVRLAAPLQAEGPSQSEVGQLEDALLGDEDVGGLHVAVDDLVGVDVVEAVEHLLHDALDLAEGELDLAVGEEAGEVVLAEVEDEVEGGAVLVQLGGPAPADLDQVHDVLVVQQLQDLHLSVVANGRFLVMVVVLNQTHSM